MEQARERVSIGGEVYSRALPFSLRRVELFCDLRRVRVRFLRGVPGLLKERGRGHGVSSMADGDRVDVGGVEGEKRREVGVVAILSCG